MGLHHEALFYESADDFLAASVPFVEAGLEADENVLLALPSGSRELVEEALSGVELGERVRFADMEELGRNPGRIISAWRDFVDEGIAAHRGVRGIGEPAWTGRGEAELEECDRHESLLNLAFAEGPPWSLVCPYDVNGLDDDVLEAAERNHLVLSRGGAHATSGHYRGARTADVFGGELSPVPTGATALSFGAAQLGEVRRLVGRHGAAATIDSGKAEQLVLAANEVATNSVRHGGGEGLLRIWRQDGALVCDIRDAGVFSEPLVGRLRPRLDQVGGRGLWIVNQVCDLVQIRSNGSGSVVRLRMSAAA